jgi:hypothetical protein
MFTVGSVCRVKRFTTASRDSLKDVRKSQMMPNQVWKWLRCHGFRRTGKRWEKYINVGGRYVQE